MKSKVLVITRNLPPLVGGMERLVWHLIDELRVDYEIHVAGPKGCKRHLPADVHVVEIPFRPMAFFLLQAKLMTIWLALRYRPRIILAGSGLTAPFVWLASRLVGARCAIYLHGLDIKVAHPLYRLFWLPFFRLFDCVLVNSRFTRQLAVDAKIPLNRIAILHPGVDLPSMDSFQVNHNSFRAHHGLGKFPVMLYVGRITPRKGLLYFVNEILPKIIQVVPEAVLVVVGDDPTNALMSIKGEYARVKIALKEKGLEAGVRFLGCCADKELENAYFAADVLVFPVQEQQNDIEGFGMVALEAAAHGLPTIAFSVGGVPDAVGNGCGKLIAPGDTVAYAKAVIEFLEKKTTPEQVDACRTFAGSLQWPAFGARLRKICMKIEAGDCRYADI